MTDYESGPSYGQFVNPETGSPGDDAKPKKPQKKPQKKVSRKMRRKLTFTAPKRKSKCNELPCNILGGRRSRKRGRKRGRKHGRKRRRKQGGVCFTKKCREKRRSNRNTKKNYTQKNFVTPNNKSSDERRLTDLAVSAKIAAALKNVEDKSFSDDAVDLLQSLHST